MSVSIYKLYVEYQEKPLGIDLPWPRLSWSLQSTTRHQGQTAYQIIVSDRQESILQGQGEVWDSGKVYSTQSVHIPYAGLALRSRTRYYWRVRIWDIQDSVTEFSQLSWWETALLHTNDWSAHWIKAPLPTADSPVPQFRRSFHLDQPVVQARLAICGLGHYEVSLNAAYPSKHVLEPGWTNYRKLCLYKIYDVTPWLRVGENVLGVVLGNGMYHVAESARYTKFIGSFGDLKLLLQLDLLLADGTTYRLRTDEQWQTCLSPLTFSSIYGGEDYDARRELPGWNAPGFQAGPQWSSAEITSGPGGILRSQHNPSPTIIQTFRPLTWTLHSSGGYIADFGQNFAGWVHLTVSGPAGARVRITPSELLKDGMVDQSEIGTPVYFQYTLKGSGLESWRPRFTYYGFRYILLEGAVPGELLEAPSQPLPILETLTGEMLSADVPIVGTFTCSNELLNRIHHLVLMAIRSNMQNLLTDCPHREKLGWLEEIYLMGPSLINNYSVATLFTSIVENMRDSQHANGLVPDISPEYVKFEHGFLDSPEWGSSCILVPWLMYQRYHDHRLLAEHYEVMQRYLAHLSSRAEHSLLDFGLGDWCDIGPNRPYASQTPISLTATAFYYYDALVLSQISALLQKSQEQEQYARLAEEIKQAFNERFFDREKLNYATGSQASNALPLVFGLVDPSARSAVLEHIVHDIQARGNHTTAGDIGYRFVLQALLLSDRSDVIFDLTQRTEHPSYGFQLAHGATTLTEIWDGPVSGASQNHLMLGHIEEWFYSGLAGIRIDYTSEPPITIKPAFVGDLRWVTATHDLLEGQVAVSWKVERTSQFHLSVTIPTNQTALLYLPARDLTEIIEGQQAISPLNTSSFVRLEEPYAILQLKSGSYTFTGNTK